MAEIHAIGPGGLVVDIHGDETLPKGPFHEFFGGVGTNLIQHGRTGLGGKLIPQVFIYVSVYVKGEVRVGGQLLPGNDEQLIRVMVTEGLRDAANAPGPAGGNGPFMGNNAEVDRDDLELHVLVPGVRFLPNPLPSQPIFGVGQDFVHLLFEDVQLQGSTINGVRVSGPAHPIVGDLAVTGCGGPAIQLEQGASPWIGNCTLSQNAVGIMQTGAPDGTGWLVNCIVKGNVLEMQGVLPGEIATSCIGDPVFAGVNGNFDADPLFVSVPDHDYRLLRNSPCIDAADDNDSFISGFFDVQGYGHVRQLDGNHDGVATTDIGAHEWGGLQSRLVAGPAGTSLHIEIATGSGTDVLMAKGILNTNPDFLPGVDGALLLDPATISILLQGNLGPAGAFVLPVPLDSPALLGLEVPLQVLAVDPAPSPPRVFLTNVEIVRT